MVICRKPLILVTDLVGALLVAAVALAVSFFVILPHCREQWRLPALGERIASVQRQATTLSERNVASRAAIDTLEAKVRVRKGAAANDVGSILEDISERCRAAGITLEQFEPMPPVHGDQFSSWDVRMTARGQFPDFKSLLSWIESRSEYAYAREIDVLNAAPTAGSECRLRWTIRVNYLSELAGERDGES